MTSNVSSAAVKVVSGSQLIAEGTTENISEKKIPEGTYEVTVSKEGYVSVTQSVVVKGGEITTVPVTLVLEADKVVGITSDNLKTFDIEFSKPVDEKTITSDSLKIYEDDKSAALNGDGSDGGYYYILSDDNKTVKIVILKSDYVQLTKYKVVVEGIKTKDTKKEFEKAEKEITLKDTTPATVNNIEITSKKTVKVYYSEPMHLDKDQTMVLDNELKINGSQVLKSRGAFDIKDNSVVYTLDKPLTTGTYEVSTEGAKDYAGWKTAETKKTVSYVVKTTAPSIVSATAKEKNKISVEFSAPLDEAGTIKMGRAKEGGSQAEFKLDNKGLYKNEKSLAESANKAFEAINDTENGNNAVAIVKVSDTKYDFYFGNDFALTTADIVESVIKYDKLKDYDGNEVSSEKTFKFQAENDNDIPTITSVKPEGQKLVISFSEAMDQSKAKTKTNYVFKTKTGVKEFNPSTVSYDSYNNAVTLTFSPDDVSNAGGTFSMTVKNLKDASVRANDMAEVTKDVTFADTSAPTVSKVEVKSGDNKVTSQKLIVSFNKPMDKATIENLSNYIININGTKTVLANWSENGKKATVEAGTGNQSAIITLGGYYLDYSKDAPAGVKGIDVNNDSLIVLGVKDSLGNVYTDVTKGLEISVYSDKVGKSVIKSAELTNKNTIKVTLNDNESVFDKVYAGEFKLTVNNEEVADIQPYKAEISSDKKSVTLTLNKDISATAKNASNAYGIRIIPTTGNPQTRNVAGQFFSFDTVDTQIDLTDKAAPSVDKVQSGAKAGNAADADTIIVTFDEKVYSDNENIVPSLFKVTVDDTTLSYAKGDYTVIWTGDIAKDGTNTFTITIKKDGVKAKKATVALTDGSYLKDKDGNEANKFDAKSVEMANDSDFIKEKVAPEVAKDPQASNPPAVYVNSQTEVVINLTEKVFATEGALNGTFTVASKATKGKLSADGKSIILTPEKDTDKFDTAGNEQIAYSPKDSETYPDDTALIKDVVGNSMNAISDSKYVTIDKAAPVIVSAKVLDESSIEITFSESSAVEGNDLSGLFKVNGKAITDVTTTNIDDQKKITLTGTGFNTAGGDRVIYTSDSSKYVKDKATTPNKLADIVDGILTTK